MVYNWINIVCNGGGLRSKPAIIISYFKLFSCEHRKGLMLNIEYDHILSPIPHQPGILLIHLLNRCNLHCRHCYMEATPSSNSCLPIDLVIRCLGEVEQLGIRTIYISGGEPFLYPELSEILAFISRQKNCNFYISSNGTLIGKEEANLLKNAGANVQVSIDGPEMYHDKFRGNKGSFSCSSKGIQELVSVGVPVTVVTTICNDNIQWLPWIAKWAVDIGVEHISVQPLLQLGRGSKIYDKKLSEEHLNDLFLQLSDLGSSYHSQGLRFSLVYHTRRFLIEHPCAAYVCNGANCHRKVSKEIKKLVIREDGTVLPEIPTLNYRFGLGSVYKNSLNELVSNYLKNGYKQFEHLCRTVYDEIIPSWKSPLVPWDEIISMRSWTFK